MACQSLSALFSFVSSVLGKHVALKLVNVLIDTTTQTVKEKRRDKQLWKSSPWCQLDLFSEDQ